MAKKQNRPVSEEAAGTFEVAIQKVHGALHDVLDENTATVLTRFTEPLDTKHADLLREIHSLEEVWRKRSGEIIAAVHETRDHAKMSDDIWRNHLSKLTLQYSTILENVEKMHTFLKTDVEAAGKMAQEGEAQVTALIDSVKNTLFVGKIIMVLGIVIGCLQAVIVYYFLSW